jgi:hypothetical protein
MRVKRLFSAEFGADALAGGVGEHAPDQSRHDKSIILGVISLASSEFRDSSLIKLEAYILPQISTKPVRPLKVSAQATQRCEPLVAAREQTPPACSPFHEGYTLPLGTGRFPLRRRSENPDNQY